MYKASIHLVYDFFNFDPLLRVVRSELIYEYKELPLNEKKIITISPLKFLVSDFRPASYKTKSFLDKKSYIVGENATAVKVMDTVVSGILFDKYSPSAILNIEGTDYLVKKGDTVNNYKILAIAQDSVTVQLGKNTYKAGIGEILTDGQLNHNNVSNLNKKFGGEQR